MRPRFGTPEPRSRQPALARPKKLEIVPSDNPAITSYPPLIHYAFGDEILETENLFRQAVDDADQFEMRWHGLISSTHLARIAPRTGKIREAHDRLALQLGRITEGLDRALVREARAALDELAGLLDA